MTSSCIAQSLSVAYPHANLSCGDVSTSQGIPTVASRQVTKCHQAIIGPKRKPQDKIPCKVPGTLLPLTGSAPESCR